MEKEVKITPKGEPRTPANWHRQEPAMVCGECWKERYLLRAIVMPVITCQLLVGGLAYSLENNVDTDDRLREPHHD